MSVSFVFQIKPRFCGDIAVLIVNILFVLILFR